MRFRTAAEALNAHAGREVCVETDGFAGRGASFFGTLSRAWQDDAETTVLCFEPGTARYVVSLAGHLVGPKGGIALPMQAVSVRVDDSFAFYVGEHAAAAWSRKLGRIA